MKALSLLQPWASLVIMGAKQLETRSWTTDYRGTLWIHASTGKSGALIAHQPEFKKYIRNFRQLPFGAIIGSVHLDTIKKVEELDLLAEEMERLTLEERAFGDYTPGRYVWFLSKPVPLAQPIPARGTLRLWNFSVTGLR